MLNSQLVSVGAMLFIRKNLTWFLYVPIVVIIILLNIILGDRKALPPPYERIIAIVGMTMMAHLLIKELRKKKDS